ncbi:hypothetical protein KKHLCK_09985 [Candidatus Electrothrix laxa]
MKEFSNFIFIVTEAYSCPLYKVGEEFTVRNFTLSTKRDKQTCLLLMQEFMKVLSVPESLLDPRRGASANSFILPQQNMQRIKFECGGCSGLIRFECKKPQKSYAVTVQGQLIEEKNREAEKQATELVRKKIYTFLRRVKMFDELDSDTLQYLALLMHLRRYDANKMLIEEGMPGTHLYILLAGQAGVINKNGEIFAKLKRGEVFGETSLLTGRPAYPSVCSLSPVQLIVLNSKNFRQALSSYPNLNSFFWNIMMNRAKANLIRSCQINSGMSGELACISLVDLFQLINSGRKSGTLDLILPYGHACVLFNEEGEIVHAACEQLHGKEALFALLAQEDGSFTYTVERLPDTYRKKQRLGEFMSLLLEGLQHVDENRNSDADYV